MLKQEKVGFRLIFVDNDSEKPPIPDIPEKTVMSLFDVA